MRTEGWRSVLGPYSIPERGDGRLSHEEAAVLAADLVDPAGLVHTRLDTENHLIHFVGSKTGNHSLAYNCSSEARIRAHWRGYCDHALDAHEGDRPKLRLVRVSIAEAKGHIRIWHRHHDSPPAGAIAAIGVARTAGRRLCGVALLGTPVSRVTAERCDDAGQFVVVEVTRVATNGTPNACSMLLGAARRIARDLGYRRIQTFTMIGEDGSSLRAAGFRCEGPAGGGDWSRRSGRRAKDTGTKLRWSSSLVRGAA